MYQQAQPKPETIKRIKRELEEIRKDPAAVCSAGPIDERNLFHWEGAIMGAEGTPYEGGVFFLDIQFPTDYPEKPPAMKFKTEIFHPNIGTDGRICVDILREATWIKDYSIGKALVAVNCLLQNPNPRSCLNSEAGTLYLKDGKAYHKKVVEFTRTYASPPQ